MIPELFKQCDCPRARWPKCDHPFHFRKQVQGRRWKVSLDAWLGHHDVRSVGEAEAVAADMLAAMRSGTFSPLGPRPRQDPDGPYDIHAEITQIKTLVQEALRDVRAIRQRMDNGGTS